MVQNLEIKLYFGINEACLSGEIASTTPALAWAWQWQAGFSGVLIT
jgi:hypothetical protein